MEDECSSVFTSCPLCSYQPNNQDDEESAAARTDKEGLPQHIAGHLQSIALISLPLPPSDSETRPDSIKSSVNAAQILAKPPKPMTPFGYQLIPNLGFHQPQIPRGLERTITSIPEGFQRRYLPQLPHENVRRRPTAGQAWRPQEGQNNSTETFDILVAEDNMVNQRLFYNLLQKNHHTVVIVGNGQEAVDAVKQRKYDVILMDITMPVMVSKI
jgi:hypothetical protein